MAPSIAEARRPDAVADADVQDLKTWLQGLGHQEIKIKVLRKWPKSHKGVNVEGTVGEYTEFIEEDTIRDEHGGGHFAIVVFVRGPGGQMRLFTQRQIKIPGDPKIEGLSDSAKIETISNDGGSNTLAERAMSSLERQLKDEREEKRRAADRAPSGFDPNMIATIQAPMLAQFDSLQRQMAAKDAQILQLLSTPKDTGGERFEQKILGNMLENESVRINNLRAQHESELRQLKDGFRQDLDRVHESAKEELRVRERQHERELDSMKEASRVAGDATRSALDMRIDGLKSEIARLEREVAASKLEVAELRARKDKTLTEQAEEIVKVQDAFKALGVGGNKDEDDDSDKPWYERMATRVMENPEAIGQLIGGVRNNVGAQQAAPQPQVPQLPPAGQPFQGPDGKLYVSRPDGKVQRLGAGVSAAVRKKAAAAKEKVEEAQAGARAPDGTEVAMAIKFMEAAATNGTDPAVFAQSARSAIPTDVLAYVEKVGIDEFLNGVNLDPNSPLRTQGGRNFARTVARILLEGA